MPIALTGALLLAVGSAIGAWFLLDGPPRALSPLDLGARGVGESASASSAPVTAAPETAAPETATDEHVATQRTVAEPSSAGDRATASTEPPDPSYVGHGSLTLEFVDAVSGAPLTDLPFVLWTERPNQHLLFRGSSDADGRARVTGLPENVLLVETARRPPHAPMLAGLWLQAGEHVERRVAVGSGAPLVGRVIDDVGAPIEGATLFLDPRPGPASQRNDQEPWSAPATSTQRDGSFEIAAVRSSYGGVWIVDDTLKPEREEPLRIMAWDRGSGITQTTLAHDGERVVLADLVLPRHAALRGRVVDAAGRPLAGRLVARGTEPRSSLTMARVFGEPGAEAASNTATTATTATTLPGEPGFELDRGEALTVGDGSFTLTALEAWLDQLLTVTPDNEMRSHSIAMLQPGEAREGIELVVPETTQLHLLLTDKSGTALVLDEPWRCQIAFQLLLRDGRLIYPQSFTPFSRPAEFAVCFAVPPIEAAGLCITLDGYEPFTQRLTTPPARRERIDCTLPPSVEHSLRLRFVLPANAPRLPRHWSLAVHACLAPPGRPTPRNSDGAEITLDCCGFGGSATVDLGETSDLELIVQSARPFFLRARSSFAGWQSAELPLGRFAPGVRSPVSSPDPSHNDWQIIELPPALLPPASGEEAAAAKALAQKAFREQLTHTTGLRVSLLDATTRAPIGGYFEVELPLTDPNRRTDAQWHHVANTESGESPTTLTVPQVARGLRVHAFGYRDAAPIDLPPLDGAPLHQLAPITLEPLPVLRVEIRDASGAPLRTEFPVAASPNVLASWASAGTSLLRGDLPEVFEVSIGDGSRQRWTASGESQPQWELRLGRADLIAFPELTLPPLFERTVALDLAAVDAELRSGNKTLFATPVGMPFGATRARVGASRVSDDPELRRFHYLLPVGRWRFEAAAMLFEIEPLEVEVAARLAGDRSADSAAPIVLRAR